MAIDELLDEHEQSERVRDWLRRNGAGLAGGVLIGLALIAGWRWWEARQHAEHVQAGEDYQAVQDSLVSSNLELADRQRQGLGTGAYVTLAALDLAKAQLEAGQRDAAIATLRGLEDVDASLVQVVDQRLARLLIDAGKHQEALQLLSGSEDAASLEIVGDAQAALGKADEARKAYANALIRLDVASPQRRLIEIKLTNVGGVPAQPEAST
ncbi:MAG: YfgM family protein [Luteimonas sp.]